MSSNSSSYPLREGGVLAAAARGHFRTKLSGMDLVILEAQESSVGLHGPLQPCAHTENRSVFFLVFHLSKHKCDCGH